MEETMIVEGVVVTVIQDPDYPLLIHAVYKAEVESDDRLHWKIGEALNFKRFSWGRYGDHWRLAND